MEKIFEIFDKFVHADWFNTLIGVLVICAITFVVCRIVVAFMRRILNKTTLLPSSSIFINVLRAAVWIVGAGFVLSVCFNVNVSAMVTGLGVVGIAISLGFQDTLSNLIGGLQVSISRSVGPGDNIRMGPSGVSGVVQDVAWRYTTIIDSSGNCINIPNSVMTSTAVTKLSPPNAVSIDLVVTSGSERLTTTAHRIEDAAEKAVSRVSKIKKGPTVSFSAINEYGFKGTLSFTIADASKASHATDAAIRAVAPYVHNHLVEAAMKTLEDKGILTAEGNTGSAPTTAGASAAPVTAPAAPGSSASPGSDTPASSSPASAPAAQPDAPAVPGSPSSAPSPVAPAAPGSADAASSSQDR